MCDEQYCPYCGQELPDDFELEEWDPAVYERFIQEAVKRTNFSEAIKNIDDEFWRKLWLSKAKGLAEP